MRFPRPLFLSTCFVLCVQLAGHTSGTAQTTKPKSDNAPAKSSAPAPGSDYSQEAIVIDQFKTSYRFEKDGTGQHETLLRVKVQSEAALERFGQLIFPYISANEKLDIDYVRVTKAGGTIVSATESDYQDVSAPISREAPVYTDVRQRHVTVPGLRPGDTLEYHVIWRLHTPLAANHFWMNHNFITDDLIVLDEQLQVDVPVASTVKLKAAREFEPVVKEQDGRRLYSWKHSVLKREEIKPDDKEARRKRREELEDPKPPHVQMTTFKNWDEVGQWYAGLERDRIVPNDKIRAKVEELVRGHNNDREKAEALYEFVARNFRYVSLSLGQGRYQPHSASDVLANEYGDCKDKHTLLSSMLIAAGLRGYPALMNSARKIDPDVPSPGQFDHVITAIPLGGEMLWADTTAEVAPFRLLAPPLRDKRALVVPENAPAELKTTPAEPPFISNQTVEVVGEVNELGKLKGHAHLSLRGDAEMEFRMLFRRVPQSQWKQIGYVLTSAVGIRGGEASEIKTSDQAILEKPFELDFDFSSDNFLDWSSKTSKLNIPLPTMELAFVDSEKQESSKPIQLGAPTENSYRLKLSVPAKYHARVPVPLSVKRDYATYASTYQLQGNTLVAERTYRLQLHELPSDRTQDYLSFVAAARADEGQALSLETEIGTGTPTVPDSATVDELMAAAGAASNNKNFLLAEQLLTRVLTKEPKHKTARRSLGWAFYAQRKFDAAISTLREQTNINPFDDYAYNLMGRAFWAQQKYAEAEAAFHKQIEVSPLDEYVHGNLGLMLVEWRKFKEAVPELEKGISLKPDWEILYVSLGRAYLNVNDLAKATEAFDKAVKLKPGPLVWNDVAYYLSLSNVQLEKAQQYAESAVTQTAADLRNLELSSMTVEQLLEVAALAAYWDTLGWVHFQKGNLDKAEGYIAAAWALQQHSEVGYHLGQIYEKRDRKQDAIHTYALAAVADKSRPEARESLERLVGKPESERLMKTATEEFREIRTIKLSAASNIKVGTEASFYVTLVTGASRKTQVAEVKFISGDEKLKSQVDLLKSANFNLVFPDETSTKLIRRGTLFCQANGQCSFIMISPDFITSID